MGKFIQRALNILDSPMNTINGELKAIEEKALELPKEIYIQSEPLIKYVDRIEVQVVEVEKEIIKEIKVIEEKIVEVPVEVIREVKVIEEKIIEVPVEKIREVEKKIVEIVHKVPNWCWILIGIQTLIMTLVIMKK